MKNILFIGMSLNIGGAEKSLVNLLNMIDYNEYNVDLLLFQKKGAFLKQVPQEVNVVDIPEVTILFQSARESIKRKEHLFARIKLIFLRYLYNATCRLRWKQFDQIRLNRWIRYYSKLIPQNSKEYDVTVAYAGGETAYYMFDKVKTEKKVYYFHSDYSKIAIDVDLERKYVDQADLVVTISDKCKDSLLGMFPEIAGRIEVLQNLSSRKVINKLSEEYFPPEYVKRKNVLKIVSVGRLIDIKGFDMAVEAAAILKKKNVLFIWAVVGEGEERTELEKMIEANDLSDYFKLVGLKENPYPYIKNADVLLQTSRFEGKSVVLDEARVLAKPVIATNYNSVNDQIDNERDGLIVDMSPEGIANGILRCVNTDILSKLSENIKVNTEIEDIEKYMRYLIGE